MVEKLEKCLTISDYDDGKFTKCCHYMTFFIEMNNTVTSLFTYVNNAVTWVLNASFLTIGDDDAGKSIECCYDAC